MNEEVKEIKCPMCGAELATEQTPCASCSWIPEGYELDPTKKEWFYIVKSRYKGPFTAVQMREMIRDTTIVADTLIWQEGRQLATTAGKSPFKDEFLVEIIPSPLKLLSDKYAECLMAFPAFICILLSGFIELNLISGIIFAVVYLGLSFWFMMLDIKECKNRGFDIMEPWMYLGAVIAPIYLIPRAERTNKKYLYSLAWLFFVILFFCR